MSDYLDTASKGISGAVNEAINKRFAAEVAKIFELVSDDGKSLIFKYAREILQHEQKEAWT